MLSTLMFARPGPGYSASNRATGRPTSRGGGTGGGNQPGGGKTGRSTYRTGKGQSCQAGTWRQGEGHYQTQGWLEEKGLYSSGWGTRLRDSRSKDRCTNHDS